MLLNLESLVTPALYLRLHRFHLSLSTEFKRKLIYSDWFKVVPAKSQASYVLTVSGHPTSTIRLSDKHNQTIDKCSFNLDFSKVSPNGMPHS